MNGKGMTIILTIAHFFLYAACSYLIFHEVQGGGDSILLFTVFLVFTCFLQPVLGLLADAINRNTVLASVGCVLVSLAYFSTNRYLAMLPLLGAGCSLFSVGAGLDILNIAEKRRVTLGIFLAPACCGLGLGYLWNTAIPLYYLTPAIIIFILSLLILLASSRYRHGMKSGNDILSLAFLSRRSGLRSFFLFPVSMLLLVLSAEISAGYAQTMFSSEVFSTLFPGLLAGCGMIIGGILSERIRSRMLVFPFLAAGVLIGILGSIPALGVLRYGSLAAAGGAIVLLVLRAVKAAPGAKGFVFGIQLCAGGAAGLLLLHPFAALKSHALLAPVFYAAAFAVLYFALKTERKKPSAFKERKSVDIGNSDK